MNITIPVNVKMILNRLGERGYSAYCVGGCVRDAILGKTPEDWDITTSALPPQVKEVFSDFKTVDTGLKHGTVTVIVDHRPYEITTFRVDGSYSDNRHPDFVSFSGDIKDDLSRRDFTVNAMAYNEDGLVDCFGGEADIAAGVIRCVGDGNRRFTEDALRIMRALRFSAALGFEIEGDTRDCLLAKKELLKNIAVERITAELLKLIKGKDFEKIFSEYSEVIFTALPELGALYARCGEPEKLLLGNLAAAGLLPQDEILRMAALTSFPSAELYPEPVDIYGRSELCEAVLRGMRLSNKFISRAACLAGYRSVELKNEIDVKYCISKIDYDIFFNLMEMKKADAAAAEDKAAEEELRSLETFARELQKTDVCLRARDLKISGDFVEKTFSLQGPRIGECLDGLLRAVVEGKVSNTAPELTKYAEKHLVCVNSPKK